MTQPPPGQQPPPYGQPQYGQPQYGQPQYGQPQYGQPQYAPGGSGGPPPPPKKSAMPWIVTAAVAVVAVIGVTLALVLAGGDDNGGGGGGGGLASDPVAVTTSFMEAAGTGDASEALKWTCGELYDDIKESGDATDVPEDYDYVVDEKAEINGDKATVGVEITIGNDQQKINSTAKLEKKNGEWKVCSFDE